MPLGRHEQRGGRRHREPPGGSTIPLSIGRVRHLGEAVAAVVAVSEAIAVDAAADVVVDWEPLPAVADPFEAMAPGAPQLFDDAPGNIEHVKEIRQGDPDAAFTRAPRVVKQRMVNQRLAGITLEPRAVLAAPDPLTGGIVVWDTHQAPHMLRNDIANSLGLSQSLVRVIAPEVGGGFGVKFGLYPEDVTLAVIAHRFRIPVQVDGDAQRAHDVHHPRPRPGGRSGGGGGGRTAPSPRCACT